MEDLFKTATSTVFSRCPRDVELFHKYVAPVQKVINGTGKSCDPSMHFGSSWKQGSLVYFLLICSPVLMNCEEPGVGLS